MGRDQAALLLEVVAEKTGYPAEMLNLEMSLEGDLGIDSIKRVEILSALQERDPELPELDTAALSRLETLMEILAALGGTPRPQTKPPVESNPGPQGAPASSSGLSDRLLKVVAEKTGYPAEMLNLEMSLEGDLGIDSIKRVEILSSLQEQAPDLPELDTASLSRLETLMEIATALGAEYPSSKKAEAPALPKALGRYQLKACPAPPAPGMTPALLFEGPIWISDDERGLGLQLRRALKEKGFETLLWSEHSAPQGPSSLIFTQGLESPPVLDGKAGQALSLAAFQALKQMSPALESGTPGLLILLQDTGGRFQPQGERAWLSSLTALARTAVLEWPHLSLRLLDIEGGAEEAPERLAERIIQELLTGGAQAELGISLDGERWILGNQPLPVELQSSNLGPEDLILASGGARGVTAACLIALARETQARFCLLGRTPLEPEPEGCVEAQSEAALKRMLLADGRFKSPKALQARVQEIFKQREIRATLQAIAEGGAEVRYEAIDVQDFEQLQSALERLRAEWGPITALIHAAGVIADKRIAEKSMEQFDWVLSTKVLGLEALLRATREEPLKALLLFSSVSARCGNLGQVDYAMANEILNKLAHLEAQRRPQAIVRALGWGPWAGGMVTPALAARFKHLGVPLIPLEAGAQMFLDELQDSRLSPEVTLGGEPRALSTLELSQASSPSLALRLNVEAQPYLRDHSPQGQPVLPMALVMEWFCRAVMSLYPEQSLLALKDLEVLRGLKVERFLEQGVALKIRCERGSKEDSYALSLEGLDGSLYYRAQLELGTQAEPLDDPLGLPELEPWGARPIYAGPLFHGPEFQVICSIEGISSEGAIAQLSGRSAQSWPGGPWHLDPLVLDGGLQLALLWTQELLGGASLPTRVEALYLQQPLSWAGPLRCVLQGASVGRLRARADLNFINPKGQLVAALKGVETHLLPKRA